MLIVSGTGTLNEEKCGEFLAASRDAMLKAREAKGCRRVVVAADPIEPNIANVYEERENEAEMLAFRGDGPSSDLRSRIASVAVKRHEVAHSSLA